MPWSDRLRLHKGRRGARTPRRLPEHLDERCPTWHRVLASRKTVTGQPQPRAGRNPGGCARSRVARNPDEAVYAACIQPGRRASAYQVRLDPSGPVEAGLSTTVMSGYICPTTQVLTVTAISKNTGLSWKPSSVDH